MSSLVPLMPFVPNGERGLKSNLPATCRQSGGGSSRRSSEGSLLRKEDQDPIH